ncbi:MAG TPA: hypothetical protein VGD58_13150 [Herpetosiphonaceae bacterium]
MGNIHYNLNNSANLTGMAPPPMMGGGFGAAALPGGMAMAGTYIIVNTATNNRYIGIAGNIANRFNPRMEAVTELGFAPLTMAGIGVTWGQTTCQNTPTLAVPAPPWVLAVPAPPAAFTAVIDGAVVNLERLLIRYVITQLGAGGTVSNNAMAAAPYINPTPNAVTVQLTWGAMGGLFAAGAQAAVWGVGAMNAW